MSLSHQDPVYLLLSRYLGGIELEQAWTLWNKSYTKRTDSDLTYFAFEIASVGELRKLRSEIIEQLKATRDVSSLASHANHELDPETNMQVTALSPTVQALVYLLEQLRIILNAQPPIELREAFDGEVSQSRLPDRLRTQYRQWFYQRRPLTLTEQDHSYYAVFVNVLYNLMCDYLGPIRADHMMNQAVNTTKQQFAQVNVHQFL